MPLGILVTFVIVFALMLLSVSVGTKYFEGRRKKQVSDMLNTAAGASVVTLTSLLKELEPDKPTGLKGIVKSFQFSRHADEQLQQAGLGWSSSRLIAAMGLAAIPGLGVGALLPVLLNGPVTAVVLGVTFAALPYLYVRHTRSKRLDMMEEQLPEALDFLARSMRAGHAFTISMEMLGEELPEPLGQEFRTLFNEQNLGAPLDIALRNFTQRVPILDVRFFSSSVLLQRQTGGNLSEILSRLAYIIRERFKLRGQVKAASAHGRLTASILTALPILTMLGLLVVAPGYLQGMAEDPDGKWLIGASIVAQILGNFFIKKIINIKV